MADNWTNAHESFAATCFNAAWDWIEKPERTPEDEALMLATAAASYWHWRQREDATPTNLSIGEWQVARVLALMGEGRLALRFAELSLVHAELPFYVAYAHEAAARAHCLLGDTVAARRALASAYESLKQARGEDVSGLEADLREIELRL